MFNKQLCCYADLTCILNWVKLVWIFLNFENSKIFKLLTGIAGRVFTTV